MRITVPGAATVSHTDQPPIEAAGHTKWVPRPRKAKVRPGTTPKPPPGAKKGATNGVAVPPGVPASEWEEWPVPLDPYASGAIPVESPSLPLPPPPPVRLLRRPLPGAHLPSPPPSPPMTPTATDAAPRRDSVSVGRATGIVGLLFVANRGLGLLRDVIIAGQFGTSPELDAYYAAFRLPDFLFLVIASGAFGAAFIPVFVGFLERDQEDDAWRLANSVLNAAAIALALLAGAGFLLAEPLMRLIAPGLDPQQLALATSLTRILLLQPLFLGVGGAAMGILNAQQRFTVPALAPVTYNLGIIVGAVALTPRFGITGLAYGVVLGAVGHVLTQLPALLRVMRYAPIIALRAPGMGRVWSLLVPRMFGQAVFALSFVVVTNFASRLGDGRVSALQFAYTLLLLPHGVFALSAATVLFPALSRLAEAGDWHGFRERYAATLRTVCFFMVPASAGLIALRYAIPEAIFQLGAFTVESTDLTAVALGAISMGLLALGVIEVVTRAFYALHDTRTPVFTGLLGIALNIPLGLWLSSTYDIGGLAFSLSLTTTVEMVVLVIVLRVRHGMSAPGVIVALTPVFWATAAMCVALAPCVWVLTNLRPDDGKSAGHLLFFGFTLAVGALTYFGTATLLRVPEVAPVRERVGKVWRRLRR